MEQLCRCLQRNKQRGIAVVLILVIMISPLNQMDASAKTKSKLPTVSAYGYVVMDAKSGKIIYSRNQSKKVYPASTAKLMTALVSLDEVKTIYKITAEKRVLNRVASDAATIGIKDREKISLNELLHMLLISSAADAADTIAVGTSGSKKAFIKKMNAKAKKLGMKNTSFDNPIGLDIGNNYNKTYSTPRDMAILARYVMKNKVIRKIVGKATYKTRATNKSKSRYLKNTNLFYSSASYSKKLYKVIGTKTGTTAAAGHVLITTAKDAKGHEVICAFFGNSTAQKMYKDIRNLLDYTFQQQNAGSIKLRAS